MQPSVEKQLYTQFVRIKAPILQPLVKILDMLGVKPDLLSYLGGALMLWFIFVAGSNPVLGFWLIVGRAFLDGLDGPLARFQKTASDRGKFTDMLMDVVGFGLFAFGLVKAGQISALPAMSLAYLYLLTTVLLVIKKNLGRPSDWLIKAFAGAFAHSLVYICYGLYGILALTGNNYLHGAFVIFSGLMIIKAISDYIIIRSTKFKD